MPSLDVVPPKGDPYWLLVRARAEQVKSDGCSDSPDFAIECCYEHDIHWRTGKTIWGQPLTENEANARLERCERSRSWFARRFGFSPWAGIVRVGVTLGGLFHKQPK